MTQRLKKPQKKAATTARTINLFILTFLLFHLQAYAQAGAKADSAVASKVHSEILLMGTFHFSNPGADVIKTEQINVMDEASQAYLVQLTQSISEFKPTLVMLEFDAAKTEEINQQYQNYLNGEFELPVNEIYQIGFRVAKLSDVKRIESVDETGIHWAGDDLFEFMSKHEPEMSAQLQTMIAQITQQIEEDHKNLNLQALLIKNNTAAMDRLNKDLYLLTNAVGVNKNFVGASAAASWWHRNLRMYAKIQHNAQSNPRIFVVAGQGHTAILRDFLQIDKRMIEKSIDPFLSLK